LDLPVNPTKEQLDVLQKYLEAERKIQKKNNYGKQNYYEDREDIITKKLVIFRHSQYKSKPYYMRLYVGDGKYKSLTLRTTDRQTAVDRALEKWRSLQNHIDGGGTPFEETTSKTIDQYLDYLQQLVDTEQLKKHTLQAKRTSIKKLRLVLDSYEKPSKIPPNVFKEYVTWRRTINWDKTHHHRNPKPPSELTINKELTDFLGFFRWCSTNKIYVQDIDYPFIKVDYKKFKEKNPSFEDDDWISIVYWMRTWTLKETNLKNNFKKNLFYRKIFAEFFKILGNSGLRPHEALKLKWEDVKYRKQKKKTKDGKEYERISSILQVSPDTKTGRREVICPAGTYFRRVWDLYKKPDEDLKWKGQSPRQDDYVFKNIGTVNSRADNFVGEALTSTFLRKCFYECIEEMKVDKGVEFYHHYTLYSCRSYYINTRLEAGVPPSVVGQLVGHTTRTMDRHYKNLRIKKMEPELVSFRRKKLADADFQTYDLDTDQIIDS
tara:strand:+ start:2643 stop:4115 length:1473 start_codon:yes stop_codon:yes gene_type:complete